ncbi:hypothetical protein Aeh1ORF060c [Aeromonas phage Aeh1]|uniref:Uncharacterized protein n=1 Tax=Aeromonas phage Aeh1 TaxID=2880362 RepID=Q76Z26_9CAUD|nr:hypothetical protein Aeh1p065 [Aeromonas phage Aeh1]AAQ17720.1 hypothetical protein Aeh1ORF060c [Aeromonas phage Aeh1]
MKKLITDADKLRIFLAQKDALKLLGVFEAKDRPNAQKIIAFMAEQWERAIKQRHTTVNLDLAISRNLSDETILKIDQLQHYRDIHVKQLQNEKLYSPGTVGNVIQKQRIAKHLAWLKDIEYELQSLWGFDIDSSFHKYNLPHCTCPEHRRGDPFRRVDRTCPLHNAEIKEMVQKVFDEIDHQFDVSKINHLYENTDENN